LIWADYAAELLHQNEINETFQMSASTFRQQAALLVVFYQSWLIEENRYCRPFTSGFATMVSIWKSTNLTI
jgi:hypothetical protein